MMTLNPNFLRVQGIFTFQPTLHPRGHTCPHTASCAPCQGTWKVPNKSNSLLIANLSRQVQQLFIIPISITQFPHQSLYIHLTILTNDGLPTLEHWFAALWLPQGLGPKRAHFSTALSIFHKSSLRQRWKRVDVLFHQAALVL